MIRSLWSQLWLWLFERQMPTDDDPTGEIPAVEDWPTEVMWDDSSTMTVAEYVEEINRLQEQGYLREQGLA